MYEDGGKGSPIIITETIKNIYYNNKTFGHKTGTFNCHFNDIEPEKTQKVKNVIEKQKLFYPEFGGIKYSNIDYQILVTDVANQIKKLKTEKAFVFIDPYGYKDIKVKDIKSLLQSKKTEVLLFLPTQFMFRFEKKGTPESLKEFITELMPPEEWPESETGVEFIQNLTEAFRKTIGSGFFVDSFIITRDKNQFFCLFFFTSHIYGFDRMLDAKWEIDAEEGRGWNYEVEFSLFSQGVKSPNTSIFEKKVREYLSQQNRSNAQLYEFTLKNGHRPSHLNDILKKLQNDGIIEVTELNGKPATKGAFYLSYKNYRDNPHKVFVRYIK